MGVEHAAGGRRNRTAMAIKRAIDLVVASGCLVVTAPLSFVIAVVIRASMGPPVLFRQKRIGKGGRVFTLLKFRTMTERRGPTGELLPDEERMTRLGRFLRQATLDELPELVNVLRGEMSLVGPRPLLAEYRDRYTTEQWRRHEVPPGMAGPVVAYGRNRLSWEQKFALDLWYVEHWSLWLDVVILLRAAIAVLGRRGVQAKGHATMPKFEGYQADTNGSN